MVVIKKFVKISVLFNFVNKITILHKTLSPIRLNYQTSNKFLLIFFLNNYYLNHYHTYIKLSREVLR